MSRSTQQKVRDLIESTATTWDLELIDDRNFSNTGVWRIQSKNGLRDKVAVKYNFQPSYCSLEVDGVDPEMGPGVVGSGYIDSDQKLAEVVERIRRHIREHRR